MSLGANKDVGLACMLSLRYVSQVAGPGDMVQTTFC